MATKLTKPKPTRKPIRPEFDWRLINEIAASGFGSGLPEETQDQARKAIKAYIKAAGESLQRA